MVKAPTKKPWTPDDLKVLKKLARQKAGAERIAKTLKRAAGRDLSRPRR